jgi:pimeloyl-ACP methyl ester carboxylesterase
LYGFGLAIGGGLPDAGRHPGLVGIGALMDQVDVDGLRISYERAGSGPAPVLVHGFIGDGRSTWSAQLDDLSDEFTVVAWDAPCCGESSDPPETFRMADFADCLAGFIDAAGLEHPHVLGHSFGTTLALELCHRHPSKVRSLVLVGAYAGWAGSLPAEEVQRRLDFALASADAVQKGGWDPTAMPGLFSDVLPAERAEELIAVMSQIRPPATRAMAYALAEADLRKALADIHAPTLLVYGEADERSTVEVGRDLHESIPGSTLTVLPGLGHECQLEAAGVFDAAIRSFLRNPYEVTGPSVQ